MGQETLAFSWGPAPAPLHTGDHGKQLILREGTKNLYTSLLTHLCPNLAMWPQLAARVVRKFNLAFGWIN